jgi:hypothetical protein
VAVRPPVADELAVAALGPVGADGDELEAVGAALEAAHDRRSDPDAAPALEIDHLVVEGDPAGAADDDVGLLRSRWRWPYGARNPGP